MIIDGKSHSEKLRKKIKDEITKICKNTKDVPKLSVILIGDYLPSQIYVKNKQKKAKEVGIKVPLVVRLEGTNVELGKKMLEESGLNISTATTMKDAALKVVELI